MRAAAALVLALAAEVQSFSVQVRQPWWQGLSLRQVLSLLLLPRSVLLMLLEGYHHPPLQQCP